MRTRPRVVIIGGGFGGLSAARALGDLRCELTVIDRQNHHTFQPLLYQVATAGLSATQIAAPIRHILKKHDNCSVLLDEVAGIDPAARRVLLKRGAPEPYDYLVVAAGLTHGYFGHDHWAPHAPGLKTLADALEIRHRVLLAFERAEAEPDARARAAWLTFVIVGGGPTGVELAGTLAEIARHTLRDEFRQIDPAAARVVLVEGGERILAGYPPRLSDRARAQLERIGVDVLTGHLACHIDERGVDLDAAAGVEPESRIDARTVLWAAGVQAAPIAAALPGERDSMGRVKVSAALHLPAHPEVFVVGDIARFDQDGAPLPGVAPAANQMGAHAALCIAQMIDGVPPERLPAFRYVDKGSLATIGRKAAIAVLPGGIQLSGFIAWLAWLFIHVLFLIGFRNRLGVMTDWAWSYFTYQRHARLIFDRDT